MNPNPLEKLLQQPAPPPDPAARVAARRAALAEFARVQSAPVADSAQSRGFFQALWARWRLSRESNSHGRDSMPWYSRRMLLGGAASICIALVGGMVVWQTLQQDPRITELQVAETAHESHPAPEPEPYDAQSSAASTSATASTEAAEPDVVIAQEAAATAASANEQAQAAEHELARQAAERSKDEQQARAVVAPMAKSQGPAVEGTEEVVVGGLRESLANMMEAKRDTGGAADAVTSADIGAMPDTSVSEALQRVPGVAVAKVAPGSPPAPPPVPGTYREEGRDRFEQFEINPVKQVAEEPVSTFSADVDTSSYSFVRGQLNQGVLPQKDAVRSEEMINYFDYAWPVPESRERPFQPTVVVSDSPWKKGRKLIHVGIKGYELPANSRPDANLVLLLDVSGSMNSPDKLPLVKQSMRLLLGSLKKTDTVGIVVYAGAAGVVLEPTPVGDQEKIVAALDRLEAGGSTAGGEGIELAYQLAEKTFRKGAVNRIMLCTDGDFNVGIDSTQELKGFVERKREKGIFLSVLGFGQGNYRDELAQALAQNGNGVAAYIDTLGEARKVLVEEAGSSLFTIARDVKLQVEFNPATVAEYRLIGYETRALKREDFNNDAVDAGDIGAGHTVTAIYEITPVGVDARTVDESRYSKKIERPHVDKGGKAGEYGFLKIRYKLPGENQSRLIEKPIVPTGEKVSAEVRRDVTFSTAVAGFAQLLRGGTYTGAWTYEDAMAQAQSSLGDDAFGYRREFVQLVRKAQAARGL